MKTFILLFSILLVGACGGSPEEEIRQHENQLPQQLPETGETFRQDVEKVLDQYFELKDALVASDENKAASTAGVLARVTEQVAAGDLPEEAAAAWEPLAQELISGGTQLAGLQESNEQRIPFEDISETVIEIAERFQPVGYEIFVQSCPMVRGGSADWLSREELIQNPYHGDRMPDCGEVLRRI